MKDRRSRPGNVVLLEVAVALLFFALAAALAIGVFARARLTADAAGQLTWACERLSGWAEALACEPDAAACLEAAGFAPQGEDWTLEEDALVYRAALTREQTAAGLRTRVELTALTPQGETLAALTAGGYFPKEALP